MKLFKRKPKFFIIPVTVLGKGGLYQRADIKWYPGQTVFVKTRPDTMPTRVLDLRGNIIVEVGIIPQSPLEGLE
jgi:hypothetical protein